MASAGVRVRLPGRKRSMTFTSGESRYANSSATMNTNRVVRIRYTSAEQQQDQSGGPGVARGARVECLA